MSERQLPALLGDDTTDISPVLSTHEMDLIAQAQSLFDAGFYGHALLDIWNAAINNLRRRIEAYGVGIFLSVIKDEAGRKKYDGDGETLSERWEGVDQLVLISGATRLGLLNKKAGKSLEMINWMRNHASPAHDSDSRVEREDVIALVLLLRTNLFYTPLPDPGHSVSGLFDPIESGQLAEEQLELLRDQIRGLRPADLRVAYGFMLDLLCQGAIPAVRNVEALLPVVWERASEDLKKAAGLRYHSLTIDPASDTSTDKGARQRLLDFLTEVSGIQYIPDAARAVIYRHAAGNLAEAKDRHYGWSNEVVAAKTLVQFGPYVPSIAFEEVYQEILVVWCGNYWGRSTAYLHLTAFIDTLNRDGLRRVVQFFQSNERVSSELFQPKPKARAIELLQIIRGRLSIEAHKGEVDEAIRAIEQL